MDDGEADRPRARVVRPRFAWAVFGLAWVACAVLTVVAQFVFDRTPAVPGFLLFLVAPAPVLGAAMFAPYAYAQIRTLGRHGPWVIGFGSYVVLGAVAMLFERVRSGYADPILLYLWPSRMVLEIGCAFGVGSC